MNAEASLPKLLSEHLDQSLLTSYYVIIGIFSFCCMTADFIMLSFDLMTLTVIKQRAGQFVRWPAPGQLKTMLNVILNASKIVHAFYNALQQNAR